MMKTSNNNSSTYFLFQIIKRNEINMRKTYFLRLSSQSRFRSKVLRDFVASNNSYLSSIKSFTQNWFYLKLVRLKRA